MAVTVPIVAGVEHLAMDPLQRSNVRLKPDPLRL